MDNGARLDFPDDRSAVTSVSEINLALAEIGAGVWELDLTDAPTEVRRLLAQPSLTEKEAELVKTHFLLPRERLLSLIESAGRRPNVPGGGELTTFASNQGYSYPNLWVVERGADFGRFDRLHVNVSDDGVGVDEVVQLLSGGAVLVHLGLPDGHVLKLSLNCSSATAGWVFTYNGGKPHIGSLSGAQPGTKVLVQVIGPPRWELHYRDS